MYIYVCVCVCVFTPIGNRCTYWVHGLVTGLVIVPAYLITWCHNAEYFRTESDVMQWVEVVWSTDYARSGVLITVLVVGSTTLRQEVKQVLNDKA
jgi:hypothetical protein